MSEAANCPHRRTCAPVHRRIFRTARADRRGPHHKLRESPLNICTPTEWRDEAHERGILGVASGDGIVCRALLHIVCVQLRDEGNRK